MKKAVFYDRDGIIIKMVYDAESGTYETARVPSEIDFIPGIFELLKHTTTLGYLNIIVSNQAGIGVKKISEQDFDNVRSNMLQLLQKQGAVIDTQYYCFHHPSASIEKYRKVCDCRKPAPGLLFQAAREYDIDLKNSWMIGDSAADVLAGHSAGCKTILAVDMRESEYLHIIENKLADIKSDFMVRKLEEITGIITS